MQQNQQTPQNELQLQAWFTKYFHNTYPQFNDLIWSVPNDALGRITTPQQMMRMQQLIATGLLSSVWDLHFFCQNTLHIIESKFGDNGLTVTFVDKKGKKHKGQREWGELMAANGAVRHIYKTVEEGVKLCAELAEYHKSYVRPVWLKNKPAD